MTARTDISIAEPNNLFVLDAVTGENAQFLSGRRELIANISNRLSGSSSSCVIYGERGVGKTTIAWQVASILEGYNTHFRRNEILRFGKEKNIRFVFHKCRADVESISDLLFNVIYDTSLEHSFFNKFARLFSIDKVSKLSHKFKLNLFSILGYELQADQTVVEYPSDTPALSSLKTESQLKRDLFETLVREVVNEYKCKLIIFIDEVDRAKIAGLGNYIKDNNLVQFVFIGIARNIEEILLDHKSAGRKLNGGNFQVPLLTKQEILWIYENAEKLSSRTVAFDKDYKREAIKYAGGMPWIAQHIGYNSVFSRILKTSNVSHFPVLLDVEDFREGMQKAIELYEEELGISLNFSAIEETQMTGIKVLEVVWNRTNGVTEDEIVSMIANPRMNRYVGKVLQDLVDANILRKTGPKYYYEDPVIRIFVRNYIEEKAS